MPPACLPAVNAWGADVGGGDPWQDTTGLAASFRGIAETLQKAGSSHLFVTAAGNQARQLRHQWDDSDPQGDFYFLPAQLHLDNMLVVAATGGCCGWAGASGRPGRRGQVLPASQACARARMRGLPFNHLSAPRQPHRKSWRARRSR